MNERLRAKYEVIKEKEQRWEAEGLEDAELLIVAFGIHGRVVRELTAGMRAKGQKVARIEPITLWPYPDKAFENLPKSLKNVLVVEMNHGQMIDDVRLAVNGRAKTSFLGKTGGDTPLCSLAEIRAKAEELLQSS
jgi:2-oxoglutarate ferredoxin oxidoreductase subunit alpha